MTVFASRAHGGAENEDRGKGEEKPDMLSVDHQAGKRVKGGDNTLPCMKRRYNLFSFAAIYFAVPATLAKSLYISYLQENI
jgi:hypothetical protein